MPNTGEKTMKTTNWHVEYEGSYAKIEDVPESDLGQLFGRRLYRHDDAQHEYVRTEYRLSDDRTPLHDSEWD
jgi:hypothetical protein